MKVKCYSVRLQSLNEISEKAYKAIAFDGSTAIIPKSQVFGVDYEVLNSNAYWIASFVLEKKNLQYSTKKEAWFGSNREMLPKYTSTTHIPKKVEKIDNNIITDLKR